MGNILSVMLKRLREDPGHKTSPLTNISLDLILHLIYCNIYTQSYETVKKKIEELYKQYKGIKDYVKKKRGDAYWNRLDKFVKDCRTDLFDIKGLPEQTKEQAKLWGVKMNSDDEIFYQNQCLHPEIGYCTNCISRRDILSQKQQRSRA